MNAGAQERHDANDWGEALASHPSGSTTRTSGSETQTCRVCEAIVTGRRRNGFCSDRCRVRARRQERDTRIDALLTTAEACLSALRKELGRGRTTDTHD